MALSRPGVITALQAIGLLITVPLMLVLVPRFGIEGAALSLLLSTCARFAFVLGSFSRFLGLPRPQAPSAPRRPAIYPRRLFSPSAGLATKCGGGGGMSLHRPLNIFVPHCSDLLTDHRPHGDGLISHALIIRLAERGHHLYIAASRTDLQKPLPANARLFEIKNRNFSGIASRLHYMRQVRQLFRSLEREQVRFDLIHQLNPVFTGLSLALLSCDAPASPGPFFCQVARDPDAPLLTSVLGTLSAVEAGKDIDSIPAAKPQPTACFPSTDAALRQLSAWNARLGPA